MVHGKMKPPFEGDNKNDWAIRYIARMRCLTPPNPAVNMASVAISYRRKKKAAFASIRS
jgi:hypothetical protein